MDLGLCLFCVRHVLGYNGRDGIQGHVDLAHACGIAVSFFKEGLQDPIIPNRLPTF